jgi:glycine cleavage system H protein
LRRARLDTKKARPILKSSKRRMERVVKISKQHVWVGGEDQHVHLGLTNYIQGELGRVISVELPDVGDKIEEGEVFAEVESTSTVHELISPVSGTVLAVNPDMEDHPAIINEDPYNDGWLVEVRLQDQSEIDDLMDMDEYYQFVLKNKP